MPEYTPENRHAIYQAATQASIVRLEQPKSVNVYEREASSLIINGISCDTLIHRITTRMGLGTPTKSADGTLCFPIKHSRDYSALEVSFTTNVVSGYSLVPLAALVT